jgi:dienelactone hydrolase
MQTEDIDYACEDVTLRGYLACKEGAKRPGVLVFHEGVGLGDFAMAKARQLAELGYVALAADMFGERRQARNLQEVATVVGGLRAEPERLRARAHAALATLGRLPQVDAAKLAAIGFCFGGSVALELARSGAALRASVSFHGMLGTKMPAAEGRVKASILVLTGAEDPLAPPDQFFFGLRERDARGQGGRLASHQLRQRAARIHPPRRRWLDDAHRDVRRQRRSPFVAGHEGAVCGSDGLTNASVSYLMRFERR